MLLFSLLAFGAPTPVVIPVQGLLTDTGGSPLSGTWATTLRLYDGATLVHTESQNLVYLHGTFGTQVGLAATLSSAVFATGGALTMTVEVGGTESAGVPVGWAGRAAFAHRAASADLADDAQRLGGALPSAYQKVADAWTPGSGFDLNGTQFSFDTDLLPTTSSIRAAVTGAAINLAAGSTMNGVSLAPLTESTIEGYITNGAINLAAGSTINGVSLAPLSEAAIEGYITNSDLALRASSLSLTTPGKIQFGAVGENSDDMYLRRENAVYNQSDLRLYMHDDGGDDDRFSIWANSCSGPGQVCGAEASAVLRHTFSNAGHAVHTGRMIIGDSTIGSAQLEVKGDLIRTLGRWQGYSNEPQDNGALAGRTVTFTKRRADTGLRVLWSDNFRVYGNDSACRWEVMFNGASCSNPGGLVFDQYEGGTSSNRHDLGTVMGTCFGLAAGTVTVSTRVYYHTGRPTNGDCHTGWSSQLSSIEVEEVR